MTEFVERPYARAFVDYATANPDVVALTGDLTQSCEIDDFRDAFPDRFFNLGMAEQNMIGVAAGLARGGLLPVVHTFGVFVTRRPLDQVHMAIAYPRLRVRLMGFLPGISTPGGPTHQAIDDAATMRAMPNMTVLDLADATEIEHVHTLLDQVDGPAYCRVMRGRLPRLFDSPPVFAKATLLADGRDLCLVSSSIGTWEAIRARHQIERAGLGVRHLHVTTLKPFDRAAIAEAAATCSAIVTVENALVTGGLGGAVAEVLAEQGGGPPLRRLGLRDTYARGGTQGFLLEEYGFAARHIVAAVNELLGLDIDASELRPSERATAVRSDGKPVVEAL